MLRVAYRGSKSALRFLNTRVNPSDLVFREATPLDKTTVLALRHNVYRGLDYLADYYDFFMQDKNRQCIVGELDSKVVSFGVMLFLDGGKSILSQAGRVHEHYEGRGIFSAMNHYVNTRATENGCKRRVALVETSFNRHARSEKFKRSHIEITSKLHYAGLVNNEVRKMAEEMGLHNENHTKLNEISPSDIENVFSETAIRNTIFPTGRILLDYVPYRCINENIELFKGRSTSFYCSIRSTSNDVTGLLSAGSSFKCTSPPATYTIDIFGTDVFDLERHLHFHLLKAIEMISSDFCLQIFIDKGFIAQNLCKALIKLDIPKYDWYVSGGIGTKTIVEDILV